MTGNTFLLYNTILVLLFIGVVFWAFGKKRKKRFEEDSKIPFKDGQ